MTRPKPAPRPLSLRQITLAVTLLSLAASAFAETPGIHWNTDYESGRALALRELKPIVLDFWGTWCPPCRRMDQDVFPDSKVAKFAGDFVFIRSEIEAQVDSFVTGPHVVNVFPTMIFLDPFGNELARNEGYVPAPALAGILKSVPKDYSALAPWKEQLGPSSKHFEALVNAGSFYRQSGHAALSVQLLRRASNLKDEQITHDHMDIAQRELGLAYLALGEAKKAEKLFRLRAETCRDCPARPHFLLGQGLSLIKMGNRNRAREVYYRVVHGFRDTPFEKVALEAIFSLE